MVPANTSSPGCLSTGSDSPVTGAWLTSLSPALTTPSSGIFSPGRDDHDVADRARRPPARAARRRRGGPARRRASDPSARGSRRARARACAPRAAARARTGTRPTPPSDHSPSAIAPATATSISTLMSSDARPRSDMPARAARCARRRRRSPARTAAPTSGRSRAGELQREAGAAQRRRDDHDQPLAPRVRRPAPDAAPRARARRACRSGRPPRRCRWSSSLAASYLTCSRCPITSARAPRGRPAA